MESTYYLAKERVAPNGAVRIFERDAESDALIGEYIGYHNDKRRAYTLYPRYNPYAQKNGALIKHEVSELLVKYPRGE